jgi:hypothetical protein
MDSQQDERKEHTMSHRFSGLVVALLVSVPALVHAEPLPYPTKPWIKPATPSQVAAAAVPTGPRMELKPVLWNRATSSAPVLVAADTSQERAAWRDLSTKPSHWVRSETADTSPGCTLVACDRSCACHRG